MSQMFISSLIRQFPASFQTFPVWYAWLFACFLFSPFSSFLSPCPSKFLGIFKSTWYVVLTSLYSLKSHSFGPFLFLAFCSSLQISVKVHWRGMELTKDWEEDLAFLSLCPNTWTGLFQWGSLQCVLLRRLEPSTGHYLLQLNKWMGVRTRKKKRECEHKTTKHLKIWMMVPFLVLTRNVIWGKSFLRISDLH